MYSDSPTDISVLSDDPADPSPSAGTLAEPDSDDEAPMDMDVFAFDAATPAGAQLSALLELLQADNSVKPAMLQERIDETALALSALEMERSFEM